MMLRTAISCPDGVNFVVDYCESGSTLDICTGAGSMIRLDCIPPAKLKELRDVLDAEIAKGARKHIFEKRTK